jgi:hypothetical protein
MIGQNLSNTNEKCYNVLLKKILPSKHGLGYGYEMNCMLFFVKHGHVVENGNSVEFRVLELVTNSSFRKIT